jgi:hypothetical protein
MSFLKKINFSGFLSVLSILIFSVFLFKDYFSSEIQIWIVAHLKVFVSAILIIFLSILIGLLESEDFDDSESFPILFSLQMMLSYFYNGKDYGASTYFFIWLFPTMLFIARSYFKRIQRIENMLTELNNEIKQLRQVEGIDTPPKVYQDEDMVQLPNGTWKSKDRL